MRSFHRQLNQYSFAKKPLGMNTISFSHPRFLRGRQDLLHNVQRRTPGEPAVTAESFGDLSLLTSKKRSGNRCLRPVKVPKKKVQISAREARIGSMLAAASPSHVEKCVATSTKGGVATGTQQVDVIVAQSPARITHNVAVADPCGMEAVEYVIDSVGEDVLNIPNDLDSTGTPDKDYEPTTAAEQIFGNEANYSIGCTVQSDQSNCTLPAHATLGGEVQEEGVTPLNDFSDCCMHDSSDGDFALFLSDLLDGGGDAFEIDDFLLADFEPVQEESGCGLAEIQSSLLSQPTGGTTPSSPQMQEPANQFLKLKFYSASWNPASKTNFRRVTSHGRPKFRIPGFSL